MRRRRWSRIEKRHARLKASRHGHVVDALDWIVREHDGGIEAQRLVERIIRPWAGELVGDKIARLVSCKAPFGREMSIEALMVAIEEDAGIVANKIVRRRERGIPVIAREDFI